MTIATERLLMRPVSVDDDPAEFVAVFNTNPEFIEASEEKSAYDHGEVEAYLYSESNRENGRCLAIRLRDEGTLIGTAALLVPHPPAGCPWVGLLIIHRDWQGQRLGREATIAIEEALAAEGWPEVRLSVLKTNADALPFWERLGYRIIDERHDTTGRPCWVLAKELSPQAATGTCDAQREGGGSGAAAVR